MKYLRKWRIKHYGKNNQSNRKRKTFSEAGYHTAPDQYGRDISGVRCALQKSSEIVELLKDLVEKQGYERKELKTLYFNIDTEYESYQDRDKSWKRRFLGYKYVHRMKIEFPADNQRLGRMLYALAHCPLSPEFSIEYTVADPEASKNELLGKAVKDSMKKASVLADASDVKLGEIVNIDYSWGEIDFVSRPLQEMSLRCCEPCVSDSESYDMDIEPDDIDITDTVTVVWSLKD